MLGFKDEQCPPNATTDASTREPKLKRRVFIISTLLVDCTLTMMVDVGHEGEASQFAEVDADPSGVRAGVRRLGLVARPAGLDGGLHAHGCYGSAVLCDAS